VAAFPASWRHDRHSRAARAKINLTLTVLGGGPMGITRSKAWCLRRPRRRRVARAGFRSSPSNKRPIRDRHRWPQPPRSHAGAPAGDRARPAPSAVALEKNLPVAAVSAADRPTPPRFCALCGRPILSARATCRGMHRGAARRRVDRVPCRQAALISGAGERVHPSLTRLRPMEAILRHPPLAAATAAVYGRARGAASPPNGRRQPLRALSRTSHADRSTCARAQ